MNRINKTFTGFGRAALAVDRCLGRSLLSVCLSVVLCSSALSQSNECDAAYEISGVGEWTFDTTGFSTSYFGAGGLVGPIENAAFNDAFFLWSPIERGTYSISTSGSTFDTQIRLYRGNDCQAVLVSENDDATGLLSEVTRVDVQPTEEYLIQVGGYSDGSGVASLSIEKTGFGCLYGDDEHQGNSSCMFSTSVDDGVLVDMVATKDYPDFYRVRVPSNGQLLVDVFFDGSWSDVDLYVWDALDGHCGTGVSDGFLELGFSQSASGDVESVTWNNSTGRTITAVIEVRVPVGAGKYCNRYDLSVLGSMGVNGLVEFCAPADANSTGRPAVMSGWWMSGLGDGSDLHLDAVHGVPGNIGYFLIGTGVAEPGLAVSEGHLCLATGGVDAFGRYNEIGGVLNSIGVFDVNGVMQNLSSSSLSGVGFDVPLGIPGLGGTIIAGDTWNFQLWYRAGLNGNSNFSNGLSATF